ncbi:BrxA family protein [Acidithiobacillus sulfuriphilus]|uniref:DUF1819 family protein n=1 Tax=Acidithiobacillus sulfuriphilus TaxID=1867749 RepID=A0ACD5HND6_9PROT|nr:BrxA family protein [Acidithiobacillus sulfuriphilus]
MKSTVADDKHYTTQLGAGLGLVNETKTLLDLWSPGMSVNQLYQVALESGRLPSVAARRLRNIVVECFAPRYLVAGGGPAAHLKRLFATIPTADLAQLMLIYTSRANPILGDFVRQVYWARYTSGYGQITNDDARAFVERSIDDGKTSKRWAEKTVKNVAGYLTGCCTDYGLLERGHKSVRKFIPFRISPLVAAYLAYELHLGGIGDNAQLTHEDWQLFGLAREDVLEEIKRLSLKGLLIVQAAGDVIRISWKQQDMEALCDVLTQS